MDHGREVFYERRWACGSSLIVLFAARYKAVEAETASMLLVSTLALAVTVPAILWVTK